MDDREPVVYNEKYGSSVSKKLTHLHPSSYVIRRQFVRKCRRCTLGTRHSAPNAQWNANQQRFEPNGTPTAHEANDVVLCHMCGA